MPVISPPDRGPSYIALAPAEYDAIYDAFVAALDGLDPDESRLFLARLALLLAERVGDAAAVHDAIHAARADLAKAPTGATPGSGPRRG